LQLLQDFHIRLVQVCSGSDRNARGRHTSAAGVARHLGRQGKQRLVGLCVASGRLQKLGVACVVVDIETELKLRIEINAIEEIVGSSERVLLIRRCVQFEEFLMIGVVVVEQEHFVDSRVP